MSRYSTVSRFSTCFLVWSIFCWLGVGRLSAQKLPPSEQLFPSTTKAFLAVADVDVLRQRWDKTQLGQLMADPVMQPFADDLRAKIEQRLGTSQLQLRLVDLEGVPSGEVGIGAIRLAPGEAAVAVVADVTGNLAKAEALLKTIDANMKAKLATRSTIAHGANTIIRFDLKAEVGETGPPQKVFYCLAGNALVASDNQQVLTAILARLLDNNGAGNNGAYNNGAGNNGAGNDSLAANGNFRAVMGRCAKDADNTMPQVRWFIEPLGYMEIVRSITPKDRRPQEIDLLNLAQTQGFDGMKGMGGFIDLAVDLAAGGFEAIHRTYIYAPGPFEKAMKMFLFLPPPNKDFAPQPWVPRDVATYSTGYVDILNAFDNFDSLFDHVVGQGEEGIWQDVLETIYEDPNGPQIHLRDELVRYLGPRVSILTDYELPITPTSERLLVAIESSNPKALADAIKKIMEVDPTVQPHQKIIRSADGTQAEKIIVWEMVEEELPDGRPARVGIGGIPSLSPGDDDDDEEAEAERLLPHAAIAVVHGHLFVASHLDFLLKVIELANARGTLKRSPDFRVIDATLAGFDLGTAEPFARTFNRSDENARATYELIRQGKMPKSEAILGRLLNAILSGGQSGTDRSQRIDGKNLPPFDTVRRYMGPAGMVVGVEPGGWFFKGILLNKEMR